MANDDIDPKDVAGAQAMSIARRAALAERRKRHDGSHHRNRGERPGGIALTVVVVVAVLIGVLALMIYTAK